MQLAVTFRAKGYKNLSGSNLDKISVFIGAPCV